MNSNKSFGVNWVDFYVLSDWPLSNDSRRFFSSVYLQASSIMEIIKVILLLACFSCAFSYRIIDIQNDDAEVTEDPQVSENNDPDATVIREIFKKIDALEEVNKSLKEKLFKTQNELKRNQHQKIAPIYIETTNKKEDPKPHSFWDFAVRIAIFAASKILCLFGLGSCFA